MQTPNLDVYLSAPSGPSAPAPPSRPVGQVAYEAYCEHRKWKGFNGDPLPQWPEVRQDIKLGWQRAAQAVLDA